jgi:hypothetical protein
MVWNQTANGMTNTMFSLGVPETFTPVDGESSSGSSCSIKFL